MPRKLAPDFWLFGVAVVLLSAGVVMVYSASAIVAPLAVAGLLALLVLAQPDLGNCLTLITLTFTLLFLGGGHARHLGFIMLAALPPLAVAIWMAPYRLRRIFAFVDPWSDPRGSGFQIIQSWLAFGNGGI